MPKFSIIIPVYNVAPYLRGCLDSVLAQVFTDWEAICVDDGSTDESARILDEYGEKDGRIRVIHQNNKGVCAARNLALKVARGEYVGFVDADDMVVPTWLSGADLCGCDLYRQRFVMIRESETSASVGAVFCDEKRIEFFEGSEKVREWGVPEFLDLGCSVLYFVRRDVLNRAQVEFPNGMRLKEDNVFALLLLPYVRTAVQSNVTGYLYRQVHGSAVHRRRLLSDSERVFREVIEIWWRHYRIYSSERIRHAFGMFLVKDIIEFCLSGAVDDAKNSLWLLFKEGRGKGVVRWRDVPHFLLIPFAFFSLTRSDRLIRVFLGARRKCFCYCHYLTSIIKGRASQ